MPFSVAVLDEVNYGKLTPQRATELCAAALSACGFDLERVGELSVALVDTPTIFDLNLEFKDKEFVTDVLSFEIDGPYGEMVGEIVVCPFQAHPDMGVEELVVHGALHLAGMEHGDEFEGTHMAVVQETVMRGVGVQER